MENWTLTLILLDPLDELRWVDYMYSSDYYHPHLWKEVSIDLVNPSSGKQTYWVCGACGTHAYDVAPYVLQPCPKRPLGKGEQKGARAKHIERVALKYKRWELSQERKNPK